MKVLVNNKEVKTGATTLSQLIEELTITRKFRGATYNITISNTKHERVSSLIVNGNKIAGNTVPFNADTKEFNVIVNI